MRKVVVTCFALTALSSTFAYSEEGGFDHVAYRCVTDKATVVAYLGEGGSFSLTANGKHIGFARWQKNNTYVSADNSLEIESSGQKGLLRYLNTQQEYPCDYLDFITYSAVSGRPIKAISYGGRFRAGPGTSYNQPFALNKIVPVYLLQDTGVFQQAEGGGYHWFKVLTAKGVAYKPGDFMCTLDVAIPNISYHCKTPTINDAKQNGTHAALKSGLSPKILDSLIQTKAIVKEKTQASQFSSRYTSIDEQHCKTLESDDHSSVQSCPGFTNIMVNVTDFDLRQSITLIRNNQEFPLHFSETVSSNFSELGSKIEWRFPNDKPDQVMSMIVRLNVAENPEQPEKNTSYLVVSKISAKQACVVGKIPPQRDGSQNRKARLLADKAASLACVNSSSQTINQSVHK
ncbi:hypothetical protein H0A36_03075 [Endozoicomonas sp. SM1973]|uniref:C-type lysozyme inhibitor domain-containing protein n=1 Tax=Spartinivicinus marinus TaxID=2994442 RepID=A0A853I6Y7_9GAMM|nr:hypothetical protein [Spartinivicinus marinus]MCX4029401.1 hypothetical protein [Spartinivicinus marinus]NYZ64975.1 hypothetical protein [Spartinivicinus marinus]